MNPEAQFLSSRVATLHYGRWHLGVGDPTFWGWLAVCGYLSTAVLCQVAARSPLANGQASGGWEALFWRSLFWILLVLGINKQLDLHTLLFVAGRSLAKEQGWYDQRIPFQIGVVLISGILAASGIGYFWARLRRQPLRIHLALWGVAVLFGYILLRMSSFSHVDTFLQIEVGPVRVHRLLELGGILLIAISAWISRSPSSPHSLPLTNRED